MSEQKHTSVILDIRAGESIRVSDLVVVQLLHKSGNQSRLRITASRDLEIKKQESKLIDVVPSMAIFDPS